jgi:cell division protein FtsB
MKSFPWDKATLYRNAVYALILVCIALIVHEIFGQHGYLALRRQQRELESLQQQIRQLQKENEELEQQIKALKSDPKAVERLAREQMRMARPGEIIYTLPEKKPHAPAEREQTTKKRE